MKKTQRTDALRLIRSRKMAFLTLSLIIALGLGGFFSSQYSARSMRETLQRFYREQRFWDFRLVSPIGAAPEDVDTVRQLPDVAAAEGIISAEGTLVVGEYSQAIQAVSRTESVSVPLLLSGRLPSESDECALPPELLASSGASVGDVIHLEAAEGSSSFPAGSYRVTGTAYHPDYLRRDTGYAVILAPEAFGSRRFDGIAVLAAGAEDADPFSDAYFTSIEDVRQTLRECSESLRGGIPAAFAEENHWIVLDRRSNIGYIDYSSTTDACSNAGVCFGFLFLLVTGLECFSTLVVIVEEEKRSVGVAKAFGFRRSEILLKFLFFGIGAALAGALLGFGVSFGLSRLLLGIMEKTGIFVVNARQPVVILPMTLAVCAGVAVVCACTAILSCLDLLRSPAEFLLKGTVVCRRKHPAVSRTHRRSGLYFRMILRNMRMDLSRVVLSVAVVSVSCVLIGAGVTVKLAHDGANYRQLSDVLLYDLRVETGDQLSSADRKALEEKLTSLGVTWCPVRWETRIFDCDGHMDSALLVRGDGAQLAEMIGLTDPATGKESLPGNEGILLQYRTAENMHLSPGDTLTVLDSRFRSVPCRISGYLLNYARCMIVISRPAYDQTFGEGYADNSCLIRLNGMPDEEFRNELLSVSGHLRFERADAFFEQYRSIAVAYNMVVLSIILIAVLISFVILIHLANIYILKKKRELIILRMNGFSLRRTKAYVAYEACFTTAIGLLLGLAAGIPVAGWTVRVMEKAHVQFVRDVQPVAWVVAIGLETLFSVLIYGLAMRKIRHYDIGDLTSER